MKKISSIFSVLLFLAAWSAGVLHAAEPSLRVPSLFSDHACLQARVPLPVWGWSAPGSKVTVTLDKSSAEAVADEDGRWKLALPAQEAGGPHVLVVRSGTSEIRSEDILIGEVWLASGQSNMLLPLSKTAEAEKDVPAADHPRIRLFAVDLGSKYAGLPMEANVPQKEPRGKWVVCSPEAARSFSGVAYYFGQSLQRELGTPVGLILAAVGSSPIQTWLPSQVWKEYPELQNASALKRKKAEPKAGGPQNKKDSGIRFDDFSACFNLGVAPLVPYALAGFLWYQGERNSANPAGYDKLLEQLVLQWRKLWGGELPFYVVQLPSIQNPRSQPAPIQQGTSWAEIREMQASVLKLPNTGLAVTMDLGGDLHPPRKREVGERLARLALAGTYGRTMPAGSPALVSANAEDGKLVLTFRDAQGLVVRAENGLSGIMIAGADQVFHHSEARVQDNRIVVSHPAVPNPQHARYLWADDPPVTIFNGEGLPAAPFRTDAWTSFKVEGP